MNAIRNNCGEWSLLQWEPTPDSPHFLYPSGPPLYSTDTDTQIIEDESNCRLHITFSNAYDKFVISYNTNFGFFNETYSLSKKLYGITRHCGEQKFEKLFYIIGYIL
jgi:hypothetical protein